MTEERAQELLVDLRRDHTEVPEFIFGPDSMTKDIINELQYTPTINGCWRLSINRWALFGASWFCFALCLFIPLDYFTHTKKWKSFSNQSSKIKT